MLKKFHSAHFVEPYPKLPTMGSTMLETEVLEDLVRALEGRLRIGGRAFSRPQHSSFVLRASYVCHSRQQAVFVEERSRAESEPAEIAG